jgi:hypothetical protein
MPVSKSSTGTILPDSLFVPQTTETTEPPYTSSEDQEPALPDSIPKDSPVRRDLEQRLVQGKVPRGSQIRIVRTTSEALQRPPESLKNPPEEFGPVALIPTDCEVYQLARVITVEIRKYWVWAQGIELLFSVGTTSQPRIAWVLVCKDKEPVLLVEKLEDLFPPTPPPLVDDDPYYWQPPPYIDIARHDHMKGWMGPPPPDQLPPTEPGYFHDIRLVHKLIPPIRYNGCIVTATYRRAFHVVRTRMVTGPDGKVTTEVKTYDVLLDGETTHSYRIENCPRTPQKAWRLERPQRLVRALSHDKAKVAIAGEGTAWGTGAVTPADTAELGVLRVWTKHPELLEPLKPGAQLRIRVAVETGALGADAKLRPDWHHFLRARQPEFLLTELRGTVRERDEVSAVVEIELGEVLGTFSTGRTD